MGSVGNVNNNSALDSRAVTRFGSMGSLSPSSDSKPLPGAHLTSMGNETRRSSTSSPRSTTSKSSKSTTSKSAVHQLIPTKLSTGVSKSPRGVVDADPAGSHVGSRDPPARAAGTTSSGNILPLKLAEGQRRESPRSSTMASAVHVGRRLSASSTAAPVTVPAAGAAAAVDSVEDDGVFKTVDKDDDRSRGAKVLYF